jgi:DNA mismatch repair protein MSH5
MLSKSMFVNADTLVALQILQAEFHPNGQMRGPDQSQSGSKESLSIYGLIASTASTSMGKERLRQMFLRPTIDLDLIHERQHTVAVLLLHENGETVDTLRKALRKIKNIRSPLQKLRKGVPMGRGRLATYRSVWLDVTQFAMHCVGLRQEVQKLIAFQEVPLFGKVSLGASIKYVLNRKITPNSGCQCGRCGRHAASGEYDHGRH